MPVYWDHFMYTEADLIPTQPEKEAAVLVPIYRTPGGEYRVVLTVRSYHLRTHPGEVALPGGMFDVQYDRSLLETAMRETEEEIKLFRYCYKVHGVLPKIMSRSDKLVTPVVAFLPHKDPPYFPDFNQHEVEEVFTVPLRKFLIKSSTYEFCMWEGYPLHCFRHNHRFYVSGLTCNILIQTASILFDRKPGFEFSYP